MSSDESASGEASPTAALAAEASGSQYLTADARDATASEFWSMASPGLTSDTAQSTSAHEFGGPATSAGDSLNPLRFFEHSVPHAAAGVRRRSSASERRDMLLLHQHNEHRGRRVAFADWYFLFIAALDFAGLQELGRCDATSHALRRMMVIDGVWRRYFARREALRRNGGLPIFNSVCMRTFRESYKQLLQRVLEQRGTGATYHVLGAVEPMPKLPVDATASSSASAPVTFLLQMKKTWRWGVEEGGIVRSPVISLLEGAQGFFLYIDTHGGGDHFKVFLVFCRDGQQQRDVLPPNGAGSIYAVSISAVDQFHALVIDDTVGDPQLPITSMPRTPTPEDSLVHVESGSSSSGGSSSAQELGGGSSGGYQTPWRFVPIGGRAIVDRRSAAHIGWNFPRAKLLCPDLIDITLEVELSALPTVWRRHRVTRASIVALEGILADRTCASLPSFKAVLLEDFADVMLHCDARVRRWAQGLLPRVLISFLSAPAVDESSARGSTGAAAAAVAAARAAARAATDSLRVAAMLAMWNITDTQVCHIRAAEIDGWLTAVNEYLNTRSKVRRLVVREDSLVFAQNLIGSFWNFLSSRDSRARVARHCAASLRNVCWAVRHLDVAVFMPMIAFIICHFIAQMHARRYFLRLGSGSGQQGGVKEKQKEEEEDAEAALQTLLLVLYRSGATNIVEFGVSLTAQDMATSFVPLLGAQHSPGCVAFAAYVLALQYFHSPPLHVAAAMAEEEEEEAATAAAVVVPGGPEEPWGSGSDSM